MCVFVCVFTGSILSVCLYFAWEWGHESQSQEKPKQAATVPPVPSDHSIFGLLTKGERRKLEMEEDLKITGNADPKNHQNLYNPDKKKKCKTQYKQCYHL